MSVTLDHVEFDVVWRALGRGRPPLVLDVPSPGASNAERAAIERRVWDALVARGVARDVGVLAPRVQDLLDAVDRGARSVELRAGDQRALITVDDRRAVLAELDTTAVRCTAVPTTGLARTVVSLLPDAPAGAGRSVTLDSALLAGAEALGSHRLRQNLLQDNGMRRDDARTLVDMITGGRGHGNIVAQARLPGGTRRSRVLAFYLGATGRYQVIRRTSAGADRTTVTPAGAAALVTSVDHLLAEVG